MLLAAGCLLACAGVARPDPAAAQPAPGRTVACGGGTATVDGDGGAFDITGACQALVVRGSGNQVRADLASGAEIRIDGSGNRIAYHLSGGTALPHWTATGGGNQIVGADLPAPGSGEPPIVLSDSGRQQTLDCTGRAVQVQGDQNHLTLNGGCQALSVAGRGNDIQAELQPGAQVAVTGNGDTVRWLLQHPGMPPSVATQGQDDRVLQMAALGSRVLPPSGGVDDPSGVPPIVLSGDDRTLDQSCAGRDVTVQGTGDDIVLRGGCRSLTVRGDHERVQAELLPGTRVTLIGQGSTVSFALLGSGPDPIVSVNGAGSQAWRVQRLGATSRADASRGVQPTPKGMAVHGPGAVVTQMPEVAQPLQDPAAPPQ
jgi:hypothetical protein